MKYEFITRSAEETIEIGRKIGKKLKGGDIIAFKGGMGAGKTTVTHGIAVGMGLRDDVSSPTFAIVNEYKLKGATPLYHFDMYRIDSDELESIGFYDYLESGGVLAIEWSENIAEELLESVITLELERMSDNERRITLIGDDRFDGIGD